MAEKIVLGFGNNIDYEMVWNSAVIENLVRQYDIRNAEINTSVSINSERDLIISILGFMQVASGGERFVSSSDTVEQFSRRFEIKITLGGTSMRAAIAMRKFGYTSALHLVTLNEHVRRLIPQDSPYVCSSSQDILYPHLIVQFGVDARVKANDIDIRPRQANRLIYHSDTDNIIMSLNSEFSRLMTDAKVFLISGFNAMQSQTLLADRLQSILLMMESLPKDAFVFCEDAGYYDPKLSHLVYSTLAPRLTVLSLNEDELQGHLNTRLNLLDVSEVKQALDALQRLFPIPIIVVHTKYWALAYGDGACRFGHAIRSAMTMATTRYCHGDDFTIDDYRTTEKYAPQQTGEAFANSLNKGLGNAVCCLPVAEIAPSNATTIGLGDAFVGGFLPALLTVN